MGTETNAQLRMLNVQGSFAGLRFTIGKSTSPAVQDDSGVAGWETGEPEPEGGVLFCGPVAQRQRRLPYKEMIGGSSPPRTTDDTMLAAQVRQRTSGLA